MNKKLNHNKWAFHKKRLHKKRKRHKKSIFIPRIIADTNIWYKLGDNQTLFDKVKDELCPTYNNLWELSNTRRLNTSPEKARNAIRKVMLCSKRMILYEPLKYLTKRSNKSYKPTITSLTRSILDFTGKIANGYYINDIQKANFQNHVREVKENLSQIESDFNNMAHECKRKIKDFKKHRKQQTGLSIVRLIDFMVQKATDKKFNLKRLPLNEYELLIFAMDNFFKKLETGETVWQRNDLFDLYNLAYVRRGDKYWTNERKWIEIIKNAGCEHYLYKINECGKES
jgi:hypothetical protein